MKTLNTLFLPGYYYKLLHIFRYYISTVHCGYLQSVVAGKRELRIMKVMTHYIGRH
jgi:hypothetical protein